MSACRIVRDGEVFKVSGEMVFATTPRLLTEGMSLFSLGGELILDLSGVVRSDSAGLALLLEWMDQAKRFGAKLRFRNVPDSLMGIARLSNAETLLPLV